MCYPSPYFVTCLNTSTLVSEGRRPSIATKKSLRKGMSFRRSWWRDLGQGVNGELWRQGIQNAGVYVYGDWDSEQAHEMTLVWGGSDGTSAPLHAVTSLQHGADTWPQERSLQDKTFSTLLSCCCCLSKPTHFPRPSQVAWLPPRAAGHARVEAPAPVLQAQDATLLSGMQPRDWAQEHDPVKKTQQIQGTFLGFLHVKYSFPQVACLVTAGK